MTHIVDIKKDSRSIVVIICRNCEFCEMDAVGCVVLCNTPLRFLVLLILTNVMALEGLSFHNSTLSNHELGTDDVACEEKAPNCNKSSETNENLRRELVCGQGCCSEMFEHELLDRSQKEFLHSVKSVMNSTSKTFGFYKSEFEDYFSRMLGQSSSDLHNMFVRTYGLLYQQNSDLFVDLFQNFHLYFKEVGNIKLTKVLKRFFSDLLQRIFILLNAHHDFNDSYLSCIADSVDNMQPFGDVPAKLLYQIKRLFGAARGFVQGFAFGASTVETISKIRFTDSCRRRIARMLHCSLCSGFPCAEPCLAYCTTVASICLEPYYADINAAWVLYIDELVRMSEKLEDAFSLANVVDPIEVTISDAIMNFQANSDVLTSQIFSKCGEPEEKEERKRRNSDTTDTSNSNKSSRKQKLKFQLKEKEEELNHLDQFLHLLRSQIKKSRSFWDSLANVTCNELGFNDSSSSCWNGSDLIDRKELNGVQLDAFVRTPDVDFHSSAVIQLHLTQLRAITVQLKMIANGLHSSSTDDSEIVNFSGGSGIESDDENEETGRREESDLSGLSDLESHDNSDWKKTRLSDSIKVNTQPSQHQHPIFVASVGHRLAQHSIIWITLCYFY